MKHAFLCLLCLYLNHLSAQKDVELFFQKGHHEPIVSIAQSADGKTLATGGTDMTIRFRDLVTGLEFQTFRAKEWNVMGEDAQIKHLEFSKDNRYLLCMVRSDVIDQLLIIDVKKNSVHFQEIQDGKDRNIAGAFMLPDGKQVAFCNSMQGKALRYYNITSKKYSQKSYYKSSDFQHTTEHWVSFKFGITFSPNKEKVFTMTPAFGKVKGQVVFAMEANTGKALQRIFLPKIPKDYFKRVIPAKDNQHCYVIPYNGFATDKIYWHKYHIETGKLVDTTGALLEKYEKAPLNHCLTTKGKFVYTDHDSLYIYTPGKAQIEYKWNIKTAKGNTSPESIKHLGVVTSMQSSIDGKSVFVAFSGNNRGRSTNKSVGSKGDFLADVITIRQIDLSTGRVMREYASLGKMVNAIAFDPKGKSLWVVEDKTSYEKRSPTLLNIWKFRDIGNLPSCNLYGANVDKLLFSPNKRECLIQHKFFRSSGIIRTKKYEYQELFHLKKENLEGQQLWTEDKKEKRTRYKRGGIIIDNQYSKAIDSQLRLFQVNKSDINNNNYLTKIDYPKLEKRYTPPLHFVNEGQEVAIFDWGKIDKRADKIVETSKIHFYNSTSGKKITTLDLGTIFLNMNVRPPIATNQDESLLAFFATYEYKKTEDLGKGYLYIINTAEHNVTSKIKLESEDCFFWKYNDLYSKNLCAPAEISALTFSPDSKFVLGGWQDNSIKIWDTESGKLIRTLDEHLAIVNAIAFHPKKPIMASASSDAQIIFWNTETWSIIAKMIMVGQNDYILYTDKGHYTATKGALNWVAFKKDNKLYSFDQFDIQYNRPDIVMDSLGLASSTMKRMLKKAYDKRIQRMGYSEEMLQQEFNVPSLGIVEELPFEQDHADLSFKVQLEDQKSTLKHLHVYVNDVPIYGLLGKSLDNKNSTNLQEKINLELSKGLNNITLSVTNAQGAESLKKRFVVEYNNKKEHKKPDLHLLLVGVSQYQDTVRNLTFASKDVQDIAQLFSKQKKNYGGIYTHIIINEQATSSAILTQLEALKKTHVDDEIILYFSCHGLLDEQLNYYLAMHDTNFDAPQNNGLPYSKIEELIAQIPARKRLMFIDACHSGEVDKTEVELQQKETNDQKDLAVRSKSGNYNLRPKLGLSNSFAYMQTLFSNISNGTGATVISAAGGMEFALESKDWGNGAFTYSILEGIQSKKADLDEDGLVKISELQKYVTFTVHKLTNGKQVPTTRHVNRLNDFYIYRY